MNHRFTLEPYKGMNTRYHCPGCKQKTFSRYIDTKTGGYVASIVGRCNREIKCGYHYTPKQYFQKNNISSETTQVKPPYYPKAVTTQQKPASFIQVEVFKSSLKGYENNNFINFLLTVFDYEIVSQLVAKYFIGTSNHQFISRDYLGYISERGATVFWQIDITGKIRTGKIMLYDAVTGKRVKKPFNHIAWVHTCIKQSEFELKQCLFGEHLLQDRQKPIAIVESEKTAVIASGYLPQLIWLAAGSLNNLNLDKCNVLKGRNVILFPDINGYDKWSHKAQELSCLASIKVSRLLEDHASESDRQQGFDLADYLIRFDYREFNHPDPVKTTRHAPVLNLIEEKRNEQWLGFTKSRKTEIVKWDENIKELEQSFQILPSGPIWLNEYTLITDVTVFVNSELNIVKSHIGNKCYEPYLERLNQLKCLLTKSSN